VGEKKWNNRLEKAIASLEHLFNYDYLYIGGGETKKVTFNYHPMSKLCPTYLVY
jgi:polyphosphate glucokinase